LSKNARALWRGIRKVIRCFAGTFVKGAISFFKIYALAIGASPVDAFLIFSVWLRVYLLQKMLTMRTFWGIVRKTI